jgi:MYXO-CTERM domain-containing protein
VRFRLLFAATTITALGLASETAQANGRFPESNHISFATHDPNIVYMRVTFGLLMSKDRGKTWEWICEQAIGFSGVEDPMYASTPNGTLIGTTFQGLTLSRDNACTWGFVKGELDKQVFIDLAQSPVDAKTVVAFASSYDKQDDAGNILFTSKVYETKDEGASFTALGGALDSTFLGYTIDLTKTDPNRIYITSVRDPGTQPQGFLLISRNKGQSWDEVPIPFVEGERAVFIAAVDPTNAERVYLRTSNGTDKPTRLLLVDVEPDGGVKPLRTLYSAQGALLGFALSPDGSKVWIGGTKDGLLQASTTDFTFAKKSALEVQCLTYADDGLWACSNEKSGFVAGLSKDEGVTFEPKLHFCDIRGPLVCPPTSLQAEKCAPAWSSQRVGLGCEGPDGGDGGRLKPGEEPLVEPGGNCNCRTSPTSPWAAIVTAGLAVLALLRLRRRS